MTWSRANPHTCCEDAWYNQTGYERNGSTVYAYSECQNCGAEWRDVFTKNRHADYWVGQRPDSTRSLSWYSSSEPSTSSIVEKLIHSRFAEDYNWLPDEDEQYEDYEDEIENYEYNHSHDWVEHSSWNEGERYEVEFKCSSDSCPLKKREYYNYSHAERKQEE